MRSDPLFPDELAGELNMPIIEVAAGVVATVRRTLTRTVRPRRFIVDDTAAAPAGAFLIHSIKFGAVEQFVLERAGIPAEIFSPLATGNEIDFDTIPRGLEVAITVENIGDKPLRFRCLFNCTELVEADL